MSRISPAAARASRGPLSLIFGSLALAGVAGTTYSIQKFNQGELSYGPIRNEAWIARQLDHAPSVRALAKNSQFEALTPFEPLEPLSSPSGSGLSVPRVFRDTNDPRHTVMFVHCGPKSCGFPFLVHGGALGSLTYSAIRYSKSLGPASALKGHLAVKYRNPTFVDQILRVETVETNGSGPSLKTTIKTLGGKLLVESVYTE